MHFGYSDEGRNCLMKPDTLTGTVIYKTERMICRRWQPSDVDAIFAVYSDPEGSLWVGDGTPITRKQCDDWLEVTAANYRVRGYGMFALDDCMTGTIIGFCGLVHPDGQPEVELKYAFLRTHWGQGLASEAIPPMIDFAVNSLKLKSIIATVAPENAVSQRVLLKSGFYFVEEKDDENGERTRWYRWKGGA